MATPINQLYRLEEISDLREVSAALYPHALIEKFVSKENYNTVGCLIPQDINIGDEVFCGFQFSYQGILYKILIFGTTIRDLENSGKEPTCIPAPPSL